MFLCFIVIFIPDLIAFWIPELWNFQFPFFSTSMDLLLEGCITFIGLDQFFRTSASIFFRLVYLFLFLSPPATVMGVAHWPFLMGLKFQELGQDRAYISETVFTTIFLSFVMVSCFSISSFFWQDYKWLDSVCHYCFMPLEF